MDYYENDSVIYRSREVMVLELIEYLHEAV